MALGVEDFGFGPFDRMSKELPRVGPDDEEFDRTEKGVGVAFATTAVVSKENGPALDQRAQFERGTGKKLQGYLIAPRTP